jgi:hypothetical protein
VQELGCRAPRCRGAEALSAIASPIGGNRVPISASRCSSRATYVKRVGVNPGMSKAKEAHRLDQRQGNFETTRRQFPDVLDRACSGCRAGALARWPYLWPAAKGGEGEKAEVEGAKSLGVGDSKMVQLGGKPSSWFRARGLMRFPRNARTRMPVKWSKEIAFLCLCHAAIFCRSERWLGSPPPRG